jgi:hypothetical protein
MGASSIVYNDVITSTERLINFEFFVQSIHFSCGRIPRMRSESDCQPVDYRFITGEDALGRREIEQCRIQVHFHDS